MKTGCDHHKDSDLTVCGIYRGGRLLGRDDIGRSLLCRRRGIVPVRDMVVQDEPDGSEHLPGDGDLDFHAVLPADDCLVIAEAAIE